MTKQPKLTNRQLALNIIKKLRANGYQAYMAGGCVRDMLLKRKPKDYDVATSAHPQDIIKLFPRTLKVGAKFGVIMVLQAGQQVEAATFRTESGYSDGRHPGKVDFTDARTDALRRDFTINGLFYDPVEKEVIDFVNGKQDLKKKIIRAIGKPQQRFAEDYLRMLRAVRFSTQLDFKIEPRTFQAVKKLANKIVNISGERIAIELEGILTDPNRKNGALRLIETDLAKELFPKIEISKLHFGADVLGNLEKKIDFGLALAGFFSNCQNHNVMNSLKLLKLSTKRKKQINFLLTNRGILENDNMSLSQLKMLAGQPYFRDLYRLQKAIFKAEKKSLAPLKKISTRLDEIGNKPLRPKPLLNGHQLMELGCPAGPQVGLLSEELYLAQLEEHINTPQEAEKWALKWLNKHHKKGGIRDS